MKWVGITSPVKANGTVWPWEVRRRKYIHIQRRLDRWEMKSKRGTMDSPKIVAIKNRFWARLKFRYKNSQMSKTNLSVSLWTLSNQHEGKQQQQATRTITNKHLLSSLNILTVTKLLNNNCFNSNIRSPLLSSPSSLLPLPICTALLPHTKPLPTPPRPLTLPPLTSRNTLT